MVDAAEQELLESGVARRISADAYCKGEERSVSLCIVEETHENMPRREHTVTHICKTGMSNCVLISPPLKKPFGLVKLGWTVYPMWLLFFGGVYI